MAADLRLPWSPVATVCGACLTGMAACQTTLAPDIVKSIGTVNERWRYRTPAAIPARRSALGSAGLLKGSEEGFEDVFYDIDAVTAPGLANEDLQEGPLGA